MKKGVFRAIPILSCEHQHVNSTEDKIDGSTKHAFLGGVAQSVEQGTHHVLDYIVRENMLYLHVLRQGDQALRQRDLSRWKKL